jgi:hypothetical protein
MGQQPVFMVKNDLDRFDYSGFRSNRDSHLLKLWEIYRGYVVREDILVNERMQRMLAVQGFLFAAFGATVAECGKSFAALQRFCEVSHHLGTFWRIVIFWRSPSAEPLCFLAFAFVLSATGGLAAWLAEGSLRATQIARQTLHDRWNEIAGDRATELGLPRLRGGGSEAAHVWGDRHLKVLPRYFRWIWIGVSAFVLLALLNIVQFIANCR